MGDEVTIRVGAGKTSRPNAANRRVTSSRQRLVWVCRVAGPIDPVHQLEQAWLDRDSRRRRSHLAGLVAVVVDGNKNIWSVGVDRADVHVVRSRGDCVLIRAQ